MDFDSLQSRLDTLRTNLAEGIENTIDPDQPSEQQSESNFNELVDRFSRLQENVSENREILDTIREQSSEARSDSSDFLERYGIPVMSQREIALQDRDRRVKTLKRNRAAKTLQRKFRNKRDRQSRGQIDSTTGSDPRALHLYERLQQSIRDGNPDPVLSERLARMMNRGPVRVTTRPLPSVPLARSIPLRNSPNILDVPYGMADGEEDGLLSRMDCPERLQWCQTNRENRENCNREPVLSRYIQPCREKSRLNKSKGITRLLINRFLTWKIAIKPDSFSEKPPGYIYFQNLRKRGIEIPTNILEFTSSMDIPNDVQTMLFDFLTMEGYDEDPLYGEPNDTIRFLEQLRGAYEHGGERPRPWDGRLPNDAENAVANANTLIVDFVNGFRSMLLNNTEYSEIEIETFIHKFLSTINLGV
jgi:hypothetical protein